MRALDKKVFRDLLRLWAQGLAIALVMACGVAVIILAVGAHRSLVETRSAFYERHQFAHVFASAKHAPLDLLPKIRALPAVARAEARVVQPALISVVGMQEPASGLVVSLADEDKQQVNLPYIRSGRLPLSDRSNEVAVLENFAIAHSMRVGDSFEVILNGKARIMKITGIVLSPEHIYVVGPGDMVPDDRRFAVFFMSHKSLRGLFDMEGAFNDLVVVVRNESDANAILPKIDALLQPYGGSGAYLRKDQFSHSFLDAELDQLRAMATVIPPLFLAVSAFLVNMILSRLVTLEREQVGLFKALGYSTFDVAFHYSKLVIFISMFGIMIGSVFGLWGGRALSQLYAEFFNFPFLIFIQSWDLFAIAGTTCLAAALAGAAKAVWGIVSLPPAVAMRPPAPTSYRMIPGVTARVFSFFPQLTVMALRHLIRHPVRTSFTVLGTSASVALLITSLFTQDSIDAMIDNIFFQTNRQDATIAFGDDKAPDTLHALNNLPGVIRAEAFRIAPVILKNGHLSQRMAIEGHDENSQLVRTLDQQMNHFPLPYSGLVISERVAKKLRLSPGDRVRVELVKRGKYEIELTVVALANSLVGLTSFMRLDALNRVAMDGPRISGGHVLIDPLRLNETYAAIKKTPSIASIALLDLSRSQFRATIERNITIMQVTYITLAVIITFGVIYNSARIQLSERARELASLRVFGFTRREVSSVLLTELAVIVLVAQPVGWLLGYLFALSVVRGFQSDLFRIPLVILPSTFAISSLVVLAAALVSALIVRRRIDRLDLIKVLKTRE